MSAAKPSYVYKVEASSGSHHHVDGTNHAIDEGWLRIYRRRDEVAAFYRPVSFEKQEVA